MTHTLSPSDRERRTSRVLMPKVERRFLLLRVTAFFLMLVAMLVILGGLLAGLVTATTLQSLSVSVVGSSVQYSTAPPDTARAFVIGAGAVFSGLLLFAFAQLILVQLAREENARITNALLVRLFRSRS